MDNYDESQDIDALLRSSLRDGQPQNPPGVDGGGAGSAETAARRRRIRFDIESLDDGEILSDEQQAELERAAMANESIPDSSKKPIPVGSRAAGVPLVASLCSNAVYFWKQKSNPNASRQTKCIWVKLESGICPTQPPNLTR